MKQLNEKISEAISTVDQLLDSVEHPRDLLGIEEELETLVNKAFGKSIVASLKLRKSTK